MDSLAHGLWTGAVVLAANKLDAVPRVMKPMHPRWFIFWGVFPDILAFGPMVLAGLWLRVSGAQAGFRGHHGSIPHVDLGLPLYPAAHSLVTFAVVFLAAAVIARTWKLSLLGWLLHILIDIPTHSFQYYATRFLWPIAETRFDGVAWWTPWLLISTYGGLFIFYFVFWRRGWLPSLKWSGRDKV